MHKRYGNTDPFSLLGGLLEEVIKEATKQEEKYSSKEFLPTSNTKNSQDKIHLEIELPGVKKEDISVTIKEGVLTVSGEKKIETKNENERYVRIESIQGKFRKTFNLNGSDLDLNKIETKLENGILYIDLTKKEKEENEIKVEIK